MCSWVLKGDKREYGGVKRSLNAKICFVRIIKQWNTLPKVNLEVFSNFFTFLIFIIIFKFYIVVSL